MQNTNMVDHFYSRFEYIGGILYNKKSTHSAIKEGAAAGCVFPDGYCRIRVLGRLMYSHRIIWIMHYGEIPDGFVIDHINGKPGDDRIENLRAIPRQLNQRNRKLSTGNASGLYGVHWNKTDKKWKVKIHSEYLGRFDDFFEACCTRKSAEIINGYHVNHGR